MNRTIIYYIVGGLVFLGIAGALSVFFFWPTEEQNTPTVSSFFGFGSSVAVTPDGNGDVTNTPVGNDTSGRVFKIANGPVAGATFIQTFSPTTTLARYTLADNGHILDLALDVPGAVSKPVSNTTIPSVVNNIWGKNGTTTILQYTDSGTLKSVYMLLATSSTTAAPLRIQFLPNNILALALSPDSKSISYLLASASGSDGYTANADGTNPKKLFSMPFSQVTLSWPATTTLLTQTKAAVGVPGMAFSVDTKTGTQASLLYASGLSATANSVFSKIFYQTSASASSKATTYSHDMATGKDAPMANDPLPEKCTWSPLSRTDIYCAVSLDGVPGGYADLWHKGLVQTADSIVLFETNTGVGTVVTLPGDGGVTAPIESITASADGKYLLFITRGDQSLWGVRLTN